MKFLKILVSLLVLLSTSQAYSQQTYTLSGKVTDALTNDPVPFASIALKGTSLGTTTSFEGFFTLKTTILTDSLLITSVGYAPKSKALAKNTISQTINIQLTPFVSQLQEVVIGSGENPAFAILRKVRENRFQNDFKRLSAYQFESYSKTEIDVDNLSEKFKKRKVVKKITKVLDEFEKLAGEDGQAVLPVFLSESVSDVYYRQLPQRKKEIIHKTKITGVGVKDGSFVSQLIGGSFQNYNFYNNALSILGKDFVSPIGEEWKSTYKYFLADSIKIDNTFCYELEFEPKRKQDLALSGKMWIDTRTFALRQIDATIGKEANLNYIDKIKIQQESEQTADGAWIPAKSRMVFNIAEVSKNAAGMLAKFYVSNRNFVVNQPRELRFYDLPLETEADFNKFDKDFWKQARHDSLSREDKQAIAMIDTLRNIPVVKTYVEITDLAVNGWKKAGKIDLGPYIYAIAFNPVEGLRLRLGLRTNADFSKKWVLRGLLGYGTRDQVLKYGMEVNYIFSRKHWTVLGASHYYDIERVGITQEQAGNNKLFYAFTRFRSRGSFYENENRIFFKTEPVKGVMLSVTLAGQHFNPVGYPNYNFGYYENGSNGEPDQVLRREFQDNRLELELRLSKNETFLMDGNERITIGTKRTPVLTFRYIRGLQNWVGGDFDYHKFTATAFQTLRLGLLGRSSYRFSLGYTPSVIPYPLLFTHLGGGRNNFLYNRFAFNTMGFFEFVSDKYASLMFDHSFEGLFFNRIPGIRKLKWRMVASANVLYGSERKENNDLVPKTDASNEPVLEFGYLKPHIPFAEVGYGIDNIFKIFKIQAFHRLTYLNHTNPNTPNYTIKPFQIKASLHFSF